MADIEDVHLELDGESGRADRLLEAHVQRVSKAGTGAQQQAAEPPWGAAAAAASDGGSVVPGTQRIWVKTFGCSHNSSDSEYMMGQLQEYGFK